MSSVAVSPLKGTQIQKREYTQYIKMIIKHKILDFQQNALPKSDKNKKKV